GHPRDVRMMNVRGRARFPQKTRPCARILRDAAVDNLEGNLRVQHCIASAVRYGHRSRAKLDRKAIRTDFHLEMGVFQWTGRQATSRSWSFRFFAIREKTKANKATQAFTFRTNLGQRSPARRANARSCSFETNTFIAHASTQLISSVFDKGAVAPHQHLPDPRRCWPLPFSTIRDNADGGAKAMCAKWLLALRVELRLPPGSTAQRCRLRRTVLVLQATPLCLPRQMLFADCPKPAKRSSTPRQDRNNQRHSGVQLPASPPRLPGGAPLSRQPAGRHLS